MLLIARGNRADLDNVYSLMLFEFPYWEATGISFFTDGSDGFTFFSERWKIRSVGYRSPI